MEGKNLEQYKNILNKHGYNPQPDVLIEIIKNIEALSGAIKNFETRKKAEGPSPPKNIK